MNRTMTVADNFETIVVATRKKFSKSFRNKTVSEENLLTCWCFCLMLTAKVQRKPFMIGHSDSLCKDVFSPILVDLEQTSVKLTWLTVCVILTWSIVVLFVTWSIVFAFHFTATVANYHKVASSQIQRSTVISSVQMKTYPQRMKPYPPQHSFPFQLHSNSPALARSTLQAAAFECLANSDLHTRSKLHLVYARVLLKCPSASDRSKFIVAERSQPPSGVVSPKIWGGQNFVFLASNSILFGISPPKGQND